MMDWTDRHCRYFHRQITRHTRLYSEMVTTGALLRGDVPRHLDFDDAEHPLALQLGGSDPFELAASAKLGAKWGYDEINLNCGCPSDRVQSGAFGACLMREPLLVRDCVKAMSDAVGAAITVKHRIGIDHTEDTPESYPFVRDFVGTVSEGGATVFIVHARNAWLKGLSPRENRDIPPLRYELVHRLKQDFAHLTIGINGGITSPAQISEQLQSVDGVMVGREAYHNPWVMADWDERFFGSPASAQTRDDVEAAYVAHMARMRANEGTPWYGMARHMLGLYNSVPNARKWRQVWSDHRLHQACPVSVSAKARAAAGWA